MSVPSNNPNKEALQAVDTKIYKYYEKILPSADFEHFYEDFSKELPAVFRIQKQFRSEVYQQKFSELLQPLFETRPLEKLDLPPYAYSIPISRRELRSNQDLNKIHKTLVALNESSLITRQEFVSMLPPCFLDAQSGDLVLDMCAAPGQKTQQLVQSVGPTGLIVANDSDLKRTHTLMHNLIDQPTPHLIITNLDASRLPDFPFKFDKILADVPCSGDGTLRKAPDVWRSFRVKHGQSLHHLQKAILIRGLSLLKVGGKLVYSTCSMNPIENEAVVAAILTSFKSAVKIEKFTTKFSSPGFQTWKVLDEELNEVTTEPASFYPPTDSEILSQLPLTSRFYPHTTNSGGFFVAVFSKLAELEGPEIVEMNEKVAAYTEKNLQETFVADQQRSMPLHPFEKYQNTEAIAEIQRQFNFSHFFEAGDATSTLNNLVTRKCFGVEPSRVSLINKHVNAVFSLPNSNQTYHFVSIGCGAFNQQSGHSGGKIYRIESNVNFLLKNTSRLLNVSYTVFEALLKKGLTNDIESLTFDEINDESLKKEAKELGMIGQVLLQINSGKNVEFLNEFCISGWLGGNSVAIHMKKKGRHALNCLLSGEHISEILVSGQARRKAAHKEKRKERVKGGKKGVNENGEEGEEEVAEI